MKQLQPTPQFKSKGVQSSPVDDQSKLKHVIQKLVAFATALVITIAKKPQATTLPEQPGPSQPSARQKPPATTSDQSSFLDTSDEKWDGKEEEQPQPRRRTELHCRYKGT